MNRIKFFLNKRWKKNRSKKIYFIRITGKNNKVNYSKQLVLGTYTSNIKLHIFFYSKIISSSKLGATFSKQFPLRSLFYIKKFIPKKIS